MLAASVLCLRSTCTCCIEEDAKVSIFKAQYVCFLELEICMCFISELCAVIIRFGKAF